jgi:hypothetical protein
MIDLVNSIILNNNIPQDVTWNIIKYLSHPLSNIISKKFIENSLYNYLHIRFDLFSPYCDKFNPNIIKHLIVKSFKNDYILYYKNYYKWEHDLQIGSVDNRIWHNPINNLHYRLI